MPDNLDKKRIPDSSRINVHEPWELRYWIKEFGVSEQRLKEAVTTVGTGVREVKKHLSK